ncbi:hypothetical protein [Psychroserpens damuponensis]|uniref:hypothetical protein n=1 Tax=Psychroserpens damuponensis TaxID=943936 RepID=UPI00059111A1|nr:hypothetical protein [Psychroserpens damuponensis]
MEDNLTLEVRKAYRLLYDYQRRILDLMKFIGETYDFPYKKGRPLFSSKAGTSLNNWAWDWIYMYCYDFRFEGKDDKNPIQFSVILKNDSGFYESTEENKIHALEIEQFKAVEDSKTELILVAGDLNKSFDTMTASTKASEGTSEDNTLVFKNYALEKFFTQDDALKQLQDFSAFCKTYNIELNIPEKTIK